MQLAAALLVGVVAVLVPSWTAMRTRIAEGLRAVA
jgi:hypothetical protein